VLSFGKKAEIPNPSIVDDQSAVLLQNLTTSEQRWLVIESDRPDPARNEVGSSSSAAYALIGKKIGEIVDLRGPSVQPQLERIVEVQSKYARLFQDSMSNFQIRFPDAGSFQSIHMGSEGAFDPSPIIDSLKDRRKHINESLERYRNSLCSLHLLGKALGINERLVMKTLTTIEKPFIRCVECTAKELADKAITLLTSKKW
jgi:hypothetical protein